MKKTTTKNKEETLSDNDSQLLKDVIEIYRKIRRINEDKRADSVSQADKKRG